MAPLIVKPVEDPRRPSPVVVGVDLGQQNDYTAICILEVEAGESENLYNLRMIERLPLDTKYTEVVERVKAIFASPQMIRPKTLVLDNTGVGRAVFDMFVKAEMDPVGITITGGQEVNQTGREYRVPKRDLVMTLKVVYQNRRLRVAKDIREAETFVHELQSFRIKVSLGGHDSYEAWREQDHDDLVLAVAIAAWYGERVLGFADPATTAAIDLLTHGRFYG